MSRNSPTTVSVGQTVNPTEALSRSLMGLSGMYAKQATDKQNREDMLAQRAQDLTFKNSQEQRQKTTFDHGQNVIRANMEFNKGISSYDPSNRSYTLDDHAPEVASEYNRAKETITRNKDGFNSFVNSDGSQKSLDFAMKSYDEGLAAQRLEEGQKRTLRANYMKELQLAKDDIDTTAPESRLDAIKRYQQRYDSRLGTLDEEISSGKNLLRKQKADSYYKNLPDNVRQYLDYGKVSGVIGDRVGGTTADDIMTKHNAEVQNYNAAQTTMYNRVMTAVNQKSKTSGSNFTNWKGSDLVAALKEDESLDIGPLDSKDVKTAMSDMLSKGKHPTAVVAAIKMSIDRGFTGDSFFTKSSDPAAYKNFETLVDTLQSNISGRNSSKDSSFNSDKGFDLALRTPKLLSEVMANRVRIPVNSKSLKDYLSPEAKQRYDAAEQANLERSNRDRQLFADPTFRGLDADGNPIAKTEDKATTVETNVNLPDNLKNLLEFKVKDETSGNTVENYKIAKENTEGKAVTIDGLKELLSNPSYKAKDPLTEVNSIFDGYRKGLDPNTVSELKANNPVIKSISEALSMPAGQVTKEDVDFYLSTKEGKNLVKSVKNSEINKQRESLKTKDIAKDRLGILSSNNNRGKEFSTLDRDSRKNILIEELKNRVLPKTDPEEYKEKRMPLSNLPRELRESYTKKEETENLGILHGNDAVKAIESKEGKLSKLEKGIAMLEGYSSVPYKDSKGILTVGGGKTGEFSNKTFKETVAAKVKVAEKLVPNIELMPDDVQLAVVQAVYRGDAKKDHKWVQLVNAGEFGKAARELLNHGEYIELKSKGIDNGITRRLESASEALKKQENT